MIIIFEYVAPKAQGFAASGSLLRTVKARWHWCYLKVTWILPRSVLIPFKCGETVQWQYKHQTPLSKTNPCPLLSTPSPYGFIWGGDYSLWCIRVRLSHFSLTTSQGGWVWRGAHTQTGLRWETLSPSSFSSCPIRPRAKLDWILFLLFSRYLKHLHNVCVSSYMSPTKGIFLYSSEYFVISQTICKDKHLRGKTDNDCSDDAAESSPLDGFIKNFFNKI